MNTNENKTDIEILEDSSFHYEGFQVVRGEFFAHTYEPSFSFNKNKVSVNMACIRKLPEFDYIQILVNPTEKKLAVRPCSEDEKDSFRWCSATLKRSPKQIRCKMFFAKVMSLMNWNPNNRYKLLGKLIKAENELLFVFDLTSPEVYESNVKNDGNVTTSRIPSYSENWKTQFGIPVEEHKSKMQIHTFKGYAVFGLEKEPKTEHTIISNNDNIKNIAMEETSNETRYEQLTYNAISGAGFAKQPDSDTP